MTFEVIAKTEVCIDTKTGKEKMERVQRTAQNPEAKHHFPAGEEIFSFFWLEKIQLCAFGYSSRS